MTLLDTQPHRILVIDDNTAVHDDFRKILAPTSETRHRLEALGTRLLHNTAVTPASARYHIDTATQGQEGLALVKQALDTENPCVLAFVDIWMPPGWDGVETIEHLWEIQPDLQVVICTAYSGFSWENLRKKFGATDNLLILRKPFDNIEVLQMANALTQKWVATRQAELNLKDLAQLVKERTRELEEEIRIRHQAEEALRASEERFRTVFIHSPLGIATCTLDGRFLSANPAFCEMLEYSEAELQQLRVNDISPPEELADEPSKVGNLQADSTPGLTLEKRYRTKSGRLIWANLAISVARDAAGQPQFAIGVVANTTERKQAETERRKLDKQMQQAQRLESLGVLAGGIAHDFNNLLTVIIGYASSVLESLPPFSPERESLLEIEQASHRAADLCRQLLAYAGKGTMMVQDLHLSRLVQEMAHLLTGSISKKADLNLNLEPDLPAVNGDATQLQQIVMNLVINASEAFGEGSGLITVATGTLEFSTADLREAGSDESLAEGLYVWLEVADTGCGMDAETQHRIFDPFFTTKFTGRGLGLSALRGIVRSHQGLITLRSQPGQGTTFRVFLPAAHEKPASPMPDIEAPITWKGSGTVLLVDDEAAVLTMGQIFLKRLGFQVVTARDGQEAIRVYREQRHNINLVLLDMTMPRLNGEETLLELRRIDPQVCVVMTSGYVESDIVREFAGKGLAGVLQKPYTQTELQKRLQAAMATASGALAGNSAPTLSPG